MAPIVTVDEIESELKKLKKDDLIRIIINKKVPDDLTLSECIVEVIDARSECEVCGEICAGPPVIATGKQPEVQDDLKLMALRCELKVARSEIIASKRLVQELERTAANQELIISLLRSESESKSEVKISNAKVNNTGSRRINRPEQPGTVADASAKSQGLDDDGGRILLPTMPQKTVTGKDKDTTANSTSVQDASDKKSHNSYRLRQKIVWGNTDTAGTALQDTIVAAGRLAWLHVGKLKIGTEAEQLRRYLADKFPNHEFTIEALPKHENARSVSFKVGADFGLLDTLTKASSWPTGVAVKRFMFFRTKVRNT